MPEHTLSFSRKAKIARLCLWFEFNHMGFCRYYSVLMTGRLFIVLVVRPLSNLKSWTLSVWILNQRLKSL